MTTEGMCRELLHQAINDGLVILRDVEKEWSSDDLLGMQHLLTQFLDQEWEKRRAEVQRVMTEGPL